MKAALLCLLVCCASAEPLDPAAFDAGQTCDECLNGCVGKQKTSEAYECVFGCLGEICWAKDGGR